MKVEESASSLGLLGVTGVMDWKCLPFYCLSINHRLADLYQNHLAGLGLADGGYQ